MAKIRIMVADGCNLYCEGIASLFGDSEEYEVIGLASRGDEVLEMARRESPDVILMDAYLPPSNGIVVTDELRRAQLTSKVLLFTQYEHELDLTSGFRVGIDGFISKSASYADLASAIAVVARGDYFVHLSFARSAAGAYFHSAGEPGRRLTRREQEILKLVADGSRTADIASRLSIAAKTVAGHREKMMKKLGFHSQSELVKYAIHRQMTGLRNWDIGC
jgi:DNA-binding NarL/FixJ family response regulator